MIKAGSLYSMDTVENTAVEPAESDVLFGQIRMLQAKEVSEIVDANGGSEVIWPADPRTRRPESARTSRPEAARTRRTEEARTYLIPLKPIRARRRPPTFDVNLNSHSMSFSCLNLITKNRYVNLVSGLEPSTSNFMFIRVREFCELLAVRPPFILFIYVERISNF